MVVQNSLPQSPWPATAAVFVLLPFGSALLDLVFINNFFQCGAMGWDTVSCLLCSKDMVGYSDNITAALLSCWCRWHQPPAQKPSSHPAVPHSSSLSPLWLHCWVETPPSSGCICTPVNSLIIFTFSPAGSRNFILL